MKTINKITHHLFSPGLKCCNMAYSMWRFYNRGGVWKIFAKFVHLRIYKKYGCCIFPSAKIGKGLCITHPVGIVIGNCTIGDNFTIMQNSTVGTRYNSQDYPVIGDNVMLCSHGEILGKVRVVDDCVIGANSLLISDALVPGTYVGSPAKIANTKK